MSGILNFRFIADAEDAIDVYSSDSLQSGDVELLSGVGDGGRSRLMGGAVGVLGTCM